MGILARSLLGNLIIWREILTFEIKKYIRNSGKSDYLAGKNTFFQAVHIGVLGTNVATMSWLHWSPVLGIPPPPREIGMLYHHLYSIST